MNKYRLTTRNGCVDVWLTDEEISWFGNRMDEGATGAVKVPTRLYEKFRKITGIASAKNHEIKTFLIDNAYGL